MNVIRFITVRTILDFISFLLVMYKFSSYPTFIIIYVLVKSQSLSTFNLFLSSHFCGSEQQILSCGLYDVPFGPDYTMDPISLHLWHPTNGATDLPKQSLKSYLSWLRESDGNVATSIESQRIPKLATPL